MTKKTNSSKMQGSKMNPKVKKLWIKALRSGEYKQTEGKLRKGSSFCCLGVLCNLHAQAHPAIAKEQKTKTGYMGHELVLPWAVAEWAGLRSCSGEYDDKSLAIDNDNGVSFTALSYTIEEKF